MAEVKVLIEGYAKRIEEGWLASSTSTLVKDSGKNILVDPGANKKDLLEALSKEGLKPEDIDIIFLTHCHLDHILNIRLFPNCFTCDCNTMRNGDKVKVFSGLLPGTNLEVIRTPGHAREHAVLIADTDKGKICVAGDLFWSGDGVEFKKDKESLINMEDIHIKDQGILIESRKKVIDIVDYIIPGHGKMFKVDK
ncbi:MAG: MBL fold metallo-hydrolase [Nanoarchaeota archaeon]|nr:MBL fold metallo-hydrolase [Nanoarchaeota archaeon]